jgi:hypothetical protein
VPVFTVRFGIDVRIAEAALKHMNQKDSKGQYTMKILCFVLIVGMALYCELIKLKKEIF